MAGNVIFEAQVAVALLTHFTFFENGLKIGAFSCYFHLWFLTAALFCGWHSKCQNVGLSEGMIFRDATRIKI